jgi:Na+-transporting NADH:ubiquinone oxidoreductase subunit F
VPRLKDYSLTGANAARAIEQGLAEAEWYQTPLPRSILREFLQRRNGPALRDTALLVALLAGTGYAFSVLWGTWWAVIPYLIYAVLYGTSSDSRWHECSHGTPFKTDWMNTVVYEAASFMVMRESVVWRWSHNRHHSDTIIVGRDPEIQIPRPTQLRPLLMGIFAVGVYQTYFPSLFRHAGGKMTDSEQTFIPESEFSKVHRNARLIIAIYAVVIGSAFYLHSWIPVFLFVLPQFFGTWLMILHNTTQHAGLAEDVLDHRLNCRTVYMNPISRFIYWNMNYHVEHHMFPLVPYHALPRLHEVLKSDCPPPYPSILSAWREILPAILRQIKEPDYFVERVLPEPCEREMVPIRRSDAEPDAEGWVKVFAGADLDYEDVLRFDHGHKTFAIYRDGEGALYATDGVCTHGNTHLADGLVKGKVIECSKHNGRFNLQDGSPARAPICRGLVTYPVEERNGRVELNVLQAGGDGARCEKTYALRVISNINVATFIKELVLEPVSDKVDFTPGDYLQFDIPGYERINFNDFDIPAPYAAVWKRHGLFELSVGHQEVGRRNNYSLASNSATERQLRFNVRIATPPEGQAVPPGAGSSYVFNLKPGDEITAIGPYGDFHIKPTQREMVYIGGGAGMAPLRAHLSHLFDTEKTARKVSYWYGARSKQELFYVDYFTRLADEHHNFDFRLALSESLEEDRWEGATGYIHEVVRNDYLNDHPHPESIEFYLCGPPAMIEACLKMLSELDVPDEQIAFDEF